MGEGDEHFLNGFEHVMTVYGYNVYKKNDSEVYDILPSVSEEKLESIIDYMVEEGLLDGENWMFLS